MVKDLRLTVLGTAAVFFICIYAIRVLLIRKEGFADKPPTAKQIQFGKELLITWMLILSTDDSSPTFKILQQVAAAGGITPDTKPEDIDYDKVTNMRNIKYNEDRFASTAHKIYKTFKLPNPFDEKYKTKEYLSKGGVLADMKPIFTEAIKKIHKKMPSYPFSIGAIAELKKESEKKIPKMEECKGYFKCSGIEKIPKSLD